MSGYRTHLWGAAVALFFVLALAGLFWKLTFEEMAACCVIALLFGLWPDVDIKSVGQSLFYSIFFVVDLLLIYQGLYRASAYFGLIIIMPILSKHRGFTHSRWAACLIPAVLYVAYCYYLGEFIPRSIVYLLAGISGYFSHLALDRKLFK